MHADNTMSFKDCEKYSKLLLLKACQVIVEARTGEKVSRRGDPNRSELFHLAIKDDKEVEKQALACLDHLRISEDDSIGIGFSINGPWKICLETSLQTNDNQQMVLEYWMFENMTASSDPDRNTGSSPPNLYSFCNVYNRMSIMLRTLTTATRIFPIFKLARRGQSENSHVILYRIYQCDLNFENVLQQSGVDSHELKQHFTVEKKLGTLQTSHNSITVTFCYRTDLNRCKSAPQAEALPVKSDHFDDEPKFNHRVPGDGDIPGRYCLPFGLSPTEPIEGLPDLLPEWEFEKWVTSQQALRDEREARREREREEREKEASENSTSKPISIPENKRSPPSPPSRDSFVMISAKALFASDECDVSTFFNGPSPSFKSEKNLLDELSDFSNQLSLIESSANQWDNFVDSVQKEDGANGVNDPDLAEGACSCSHSCIAGEINDRVPNPSPNDEEEVEEGLGSDDDGQCDPDNPEGFVFVRRDCGNGIRTQGRSHYDGEGNLNEDSLTRRLQAACVELEVEALMRNDSSDSDQARPQQDSDEDGLIFDMNSAQGKEDKA